MRQVVASLLIFSYLKIINYLNYWYISLLGSEFVNFILADHVAY